jgi:hypothetical protein
MTYQTAILLLTPPLVGVLIGFTLRGRLAGIARVRLQGLWLLWVAAAVQVTQFWVPPVREFVEEQAHVPMLGLIFLIVAIWLGWNLRQPPMLRVTIAAILLGASLNAAAILANGRMPYSPHAAAIAGRPIDSVTPKNEPAHDGTRLAGLGDVIPVPPIRKVVSPGDVLISLGSASLIAVAMRRLSNGSDAGRSTDERTTAGT